MLRFKPVIFGWSLFCLMSLSFVAVALMPPMSDAELKDNANLIVLGKVLKVEKTGKVKKTDCAKITYYKAALKIDKTLKGKKLEEVSLFFGDTKFKEGCVGSPDTIHTEGDVGKYYLQCTDDRCHLVHWNGVKSLTEGKEI